MKAVNLVPKDARRSSLRVAGSAGPGLSSDAFGPATAVIALLVILVGLIALRVLADNNVKDKQATLSAMQSQVGVEQGQAAKLSRYTTFIQNAQTRENQVRAVAEQRFPWARTLDQISRVMPRTTWLSSLSASTTGGATTSSSTTTSGTAGSATPTNSGPTFTLAGCADTPDQNGTATLLRRLRTLTGVTSVGFQSSTRSADCGNSFNLTLAFDSPGTTTAGPATTVAAASGTAASAPTTSTTPVASTATTEETSG